MKTGHCVVSDAGVYTIRGCSVSVGGSLSCCEFKYGIVML